MKKPVLLTIGIVIVAVIVICCTTYFNRQASLGIIGGADGPTTVYVAGTLGSWVVPLFVVILLLLVAIFFYRKRKH